MKNEFFRKAGSWLGFSRRERRASVFLLLIILLVIVLKYLWPGRNGKTEIIYPDISSRAVATADYGGKDSLSYSSGRKGRSSFKPRVLELNTCDSASLESLPAIGPVLARRIIRYRKLLGGYYSAEQLKEVYGLRDSVYEIIRDRVKADPKLTRKINVNTAGFAEMSGLPYLSKKEVNAMMEFRARLGKIESLGQLVDNYILPDTTARKVKWYLDFR